MRWIVWIVAAIALVGVVIVIIGAMLPQKHTASRTARIPLPPDALYPLLVQMAQASTDPPVRLERQEPPSLLVSRIADPNLPFGGSWTYRVAPAGSGASDLTITEDGEVYNVFFRFMSRFVIGHHATMDAFLKDLTAKAAAR